MPPGPLPTAHKRALADIPVVVARDTEPAKARGFRPRPGVPQSLTALTSRGPLPAQSEIASPFSSEIFIGAPSG